ncbi:hypothetical protein TTHERM_000151977 (macronuclear) [Tetrahymena thermophila SB210]|uniref:Uncharacterized protein n=1 Tax=Tetrahymena thermophila (strain SB210) TaxID=312017 RepID=W7X6Q4_TETTS|nr:hypothetical protein TTHERM_000151977 [Tetrahymena thermophila SB210]EWS73057.1 hypothetical protein TTHERM_000151977 [Tetrahymena thermophila SB210]|eukprot:XP_012654454.1 hypothetical protein TTHERM_000151977 [Tetrahymena thermophila SB210]
MLQLSISIILLVNQIKSLSYSCFRLQNAFKLSFITSILLDFGSLLIMESYSLDYGWAQYEKTSSLDNSYRISSLKDCGREKQIILLEEIKESTTFFKFSQFFSYSQILDFTIDYTYQFISSYQNELEFINSCQRYSFSAELLYYEVIYEQFTKYY